jgi:hypothetical protein
VDSHQVVFERDGGRLFRVKLSRDGTVLNVQRFSIVPDYDVWFCRRELRAAYGRFSEVHSIDIVGSSARTRLGSWT